MRLVIREYLRLLKEKDELDELLPDLLLKMGYIPTSRAQSGVRQGGVDIAAAGKNENGVDNLKLFVVKCGKITRSSWSSNHNSVRPSLEQVLDDYIPNRLQKDHQDHLITIVVCTNGVMDQSIADNDWRGFKEKNTEKGKIEFDFWGLDKLSELVETHLLDEFALPEESRSDFRKALALIAEPEYDLAHYYRLLEKILFYDNEGFSEDKEFKTFKLAINTCNLLINMMFYWAKSEGNLRHVLPAAERTLLLSWELVRQKRYCETTKAMDIYVTLFNTHGKICAEYFRKMQGHYHTRDALSIHASEHILVSESVFEQIGIVSLIGLLQDNDENRQIISEGLCNIINNNPSSAVPCYDRHAIEINLGLMLLFGTGRITSAKNWLDILCGSFVFCFQQGRHFPIGTSSFDDAVDLSVEHWTGPVVDKAKSASTLLAVYAQWCCVFGLTDVYAALRKCQQELPQMAVQLWFPDQDTEDKMYVGPAMDTGTTLVPIELPESMDEFKQQIKELDDVEFIVDHNGFEATQSGFLGIILMASRHYKTPIFPSIWQQLILDESDLAKVKIIKPDAD